MDTLDFYKKTKVDIDETKELINWKNLSKYLTGDEMRIRKGRIPKRYKQDVENLLGEIACTVLNYKRA